MMKHKNYCTISCLLLLPLFVSCVDDGSTGSGSDPASLAMTEPEMNAPGDDDTDEGSPSSNSDDDTSDQDSPEPDVASEEPTVEPGADPSDDDSASGEDDFAPADDDSASGDDDVVVAPEPEANATDAGIDSTEPEEVPVSGEPGAQPLVDAGQGMAWPDAGEFGEASADGGSDVAVTDGVRLRAVLTEVSEGTLGIAGEWTNGTDEPIYLQGCSTTSGWYLDGGEWIEHGGFILCFQEGPMVVVGPGETYLDPAGAPPSDRGTNTWRLQGPYGVGCVPAEGLFSEANCAAVTDVISENEVSVAP